MMTATKRLMPGFCVAAVLAACGSSPAVTYYDLSSLEAGYEADNDSSLAVGVGPLRMPDYLSRPKMVTRGDDGAINVNDFNRWVEPVDEAAHRVVASNLDTLLDSAVVVAFPYTHIRELDYRVIGRVDRFDADQDGTAVLEIQWGVIASDDVLLVQPRRARYEVRFSADGGYQAIAYAMSEALQQFSRDIAHVLEALSSERDD